MLARPRFPEFSRGILRNNRHTRANQKMLSIPEFSSCQNISVIARGVKLKIFGGCRCGQVDLKSSTFVSGVDKKKTLGL